MITSRRRYVLRSGEVLESEQPLAMVRLNQRAASVGLKGDTDQPPVCMRSPTSELSVVRRLCDRGRRADSCRIASATGRRRCCSGSGAGRRSDQHSVASTFNLDP